MDRYCSHGITAIDWFRIDCEQEDIRVWRIYERRQKIKENIKI